MLSNLCTPWGPLVLKEIWGGRNFFHPLGSRAWFKLFLAIVPEKEYPKLVLKFWGLSQKNLVVKISPNFVIFRLVCPLLQNSTRYQQFENGLLNHRHSSTDGKNGVLRCTTNYVIEARKHPPSDLIAGLYTRWHARGRCGQRYSNLMQ